MWSRWGRRAKETNKLGLSSTVAAKSAASCSRREQFVHCPSLDMFLQIQPSGVRQAYTAPATKVRLLKTRSGRGNATRLRDPDDRTRPIRCVTGGPSSFLTRCLDMHTSSRSAPNHHMLPNREVLGRTGCKCIEASVMRRIRSLAGRIVHMHNERLLNIATRGVIVGGTSEAGRSARHPQHCAVSRNAVFTSE